MEVAGKNITVQIWYVSYYRSCHAVYMWEIMDILFPAKIRDTAGQERFGTITKSCYRGSIGVILVYGINDRNTYDDVNKWLNDIKLVSIIAASSHPDIVQTAAGYVVCNYIRLSHPLLPVYVFSTTAYTSLTLNMNFKFPK